MTKREMMIQAHKMAKQMVGNYSARLSLALRQLWASLKKGVAMMVELIGTEKQVKWANEIREYVTYEIEAGMANVEFVEKDLSKVEVIKKDMDNDQAKFWIDTFKSAGNDKLRPIFDYLQDRIGSRKTGIKICEAINRIHGF